VGLGDGKVGVLEIDEDGIIAGGLGQEYQLIVGDELYTNCLFVSRILVMLRRPDC
jgi:hypothetical protein